MHARSGLAARVDGEGERGFRERGARPVEVLVLDAVVGVPALPAFHSQCVLAPVVVGDERHAPGRSPEDLYPETRGVVESAVRLPTIDQPSLDLQLRGGEDLNAYAVEKPRSVRRYVRRLVRPVVELVVAE